MKLYSKISLVNLLIFGSIVFLSIALFYFSSRYILIDEQKKDLTDLAIHYFKPSAGKSSMGNSINQFRMMKQGLTETVYVAKSVSEGNLQVIQDPYGIGDLAEIGLFRLEEYDFLGMEFVDSGTHYVFVREVSSIIKSLNSMSNGFLILSAVLIAIAGFFATISAKYSLRPLLKLIKNISTINTSKLKTRFEISKSLDEIDELKSSLNQMLLKLDEGFELQKRFNSDVSHELRTPITSIKGYAQLLRKWGMENRNIAEESVDAIITTSFEMEMLIEQLLTLGRMEEMIPEVEPVNSAEFVVNLKDRIERKFPAGKFEWDSGDVYETYECNSEYLIILAEIFIDNAVKYSDEDSLIEICFFKNRITITDHGIGIPEDEVERIFNRFYRTDNSRSRNRDVISHGIGLSIAQTIAEKLKIKIEVKSELKKGTEITLTIPEYSVPKSG